MPEHYDIQPVTDKKTLKDFIRAPVAAYRDDPGAGASP